MTLACKILNQLISKRSRPKEEILNMADVFYASGRITEKEYTDVVSKLK